MEYCKKCVMPNTTEASNFKNGLCPGCQAQKSKKAVNWNKKHKELDKIMDNAKKSAGNNYDCIVPISGGKDSVYQLHIVCKEYGLKPLAVTFNHGGFTQTGMYNLLNALDKFNIDHIMFTLNNDLIKRIQKRSIETIGDYCWHCHNMVNSFTLQMACQYRIPLIVWGESGAEYGHQGADYNNIVRFDKDYFTKLSSKLTPEEFACEYISIRDLYPCNVPNDTFLDLIIGIHLGNYIPWDTESQVKMIKEVYGWRGREVGGSYKDYKSIECSFEPMHEYLCLLKRGYGRTSLQASQEVRDGIITKNEAKTLVDHYERIKPKHLVYYLKRIGMLPQQMTCIVNKMRHKNMDANWINGKEWRECNEDGKPWAERFLEDMAHDQRD